MRTNQEISETPEERIRVVVEKFVFHMKKSNVDKFLAEMDGVLKKYEDDYTYFNVRVE